MLIMCVHINIYILKNYRYKDTCNGDNYIGHRKQQRLAYHMFTCKFPASSLQFSMSVVIVIITSLFKTVVF